MQCIKKKARCTKLQAITVFQIFMVKNLAIEKVLLKNLGNHNAECIMLLEPMTNILREPLLAALSKQGKQSRAKQP